MTWNKFEKLKPIALEKGDWDGLKSDLLLVCDKNFEYNVAECYVEVYQGENVYIFYDKNGFEIPHVLYWKELESCPFI